MGYISYWDFKSHRRATQIRIWREDPGHGTAQKQLFLNMTLLTYF